MEDSQQRKIEQRALTDIINTFKKGVDQSEAYETEKVRERAYAERVLQSWITGEVDFRTAQKYFEVRSMFYQRPQVTENGN